MSKGSRGKVLLWCLFAGNKALVLLQLLHFTLATRSSFPTDITPGVNSTADGKIYQETSEKKKN